MRFWKWHFCIWVDGQQPIGNFGFDIIKGEIVIFSFSNFWLKSNLNLPFDF